MLSILHISDLHRSRIEPVTNDALLASLILDRDRYTRETPPIHAPNAIVVSGDIIQGTPLNHPGSAGEIAAQYDVAHDFLTRLSDRFVDGDRRRVVIVPGNHDVDWNEAKASMDPVPIAAYPPDLFAELSRKGTDLRWDWQTRTLYQIVRRDRYVARMAAFRRFLERFYEDVPFRYPLATADGFGLFELADGKVAVAGFNSCSENDCFARIGLISDDAVGRAVMQLHDSGRRYELQMAVWHHGVHGPPQSSDYMNVDTLYDLINGGFRLGLHGHQHRGEVTAHYLHLPERATIAVVSAGSLCAGVRDLPRGVNRQYNIIEISDDFIHARIHVRLMAAANVFERGQLLEFGGNSHVDMEWERPTDPYGRPINIAMERMRAAVLEADRLARLGDYDGSILLLKEQGTLDPFGRRLLANAYLERQRWADLARLTADPRTINELVLHVRALAAERSFDAARQALANYGPAVGLPDATRRDLLELVEAHQRIGR